MNARGWILSILLVPVLYLLSVPIATELWVRSTLSICKPAPPKWLVSFRAPYDWIEMHTPLKGPMQAYRNSLRNVFRLGL